MLPRRAIFDQEHEMFRDSVRKFFKAESEPHLERWSKQGQVDRDFWNKCGDAGLLCMNLTEENGGYDDYRFCAVLNEEQAYSRGGGAAFAVHSDIVASYIEHYGSDAQKEAWLPKMVSGEAVGAIAMTEPGTGSDLQSVKTSAVEDGADLIISGAKTFISNGQHCDVVIVVAVTDPEAGGAKGISLILVEAGREGFTRGRNLDKIGQHSADTSELFFDNVRVPNENILGAPGMGFVYLMQELPQERLSIASTGMGQMQRAFDITVEYVKERTAFGAPIMKFQNTRFVLADLKTRIAAGWALYDDSLAKHLRSELDVVGAAMVKLYVTELASEVMDKCLQLHGGYGYMNEYEIAELYKDSRVQRIYGGTSEIMKELIGRSL